MKRRLAVMATVVVAAVALSGCPGGTHYADCDAARKASAAPLHKGDPGYRSELDRDGNGVACE